MARPVTVGPHRRVDTRVPPDLHEQMTAEAKARGISIAEFASQILAAHAGEHLGEGHLLAS